MGTNINLRFARRLKHARESLNLSQTELAEKVGISSSTLSRYERNKIDRVPGSIVQSLADVLGLSPSWLGGLIEDETPIYAEHIKKHPLKRDNPKENKLINSYRSLNKKGKSLAESMMKAITCDPDLVDPTSKSFLDDQFENSSSPILMAAHGTTEDMTDEEMDLVHKDFEKLMELDRKMHPEDYDD